MAPPRRIRLAVALGVALCSAASASSGHARLAACRPTLANQLTSTGSSTQLVTVLAARRTATRGALQLWRKRGDCWLSAGGPWPAWLGERGTSLHKREGDRTTPAGAFGFGPVMYGLATNPGVHYPYRRIVCGDWWVEDPRSPYYNQFHHVRCGATPPFRVTSEDMSRSPTAYRHLAVIAYNTNPVVPGHGSGIFLHASTGRPTLGCVSVALPQLVTLLRWLRAENEPLIVIGTRADFRGF
jgi:L,D-peptidoglycan transpeptidase YkuD (ErfK/YbiS/YcfS/YnhG family)